MAPPPGYSPASMNRQTVQPLGAPAMHGMPITGGGSLGNSAPYGSSLGRPGMPPAPGTSIHGPPLGGAGMAPPGVTNMASALGR